ncbi:bifunctional riboflavin kinase/FAD synthetase [uncultured Tyzzerella sp.]|uniref:bifunctional riboflavin kinase/FAD synthetase n=1 Tax=uncultured Tyzzerella sp. TaxID=2321398 RepID=UPI0029432D5B|nr:bifunctional riboflavin kinase/FAD synthetase [uncultured Tyzzerella sp.]
MNIIDNFNIFDNNKFGTVVTIGNFDGVHIGHKKLINITKKYALKEDLKSVVITFSPHPLEIIKKASPFFYIFSEEEKNMEMEKENIDYFIKYPFTKEFSKIEPQDFVDILIEKLNCKILVVGEDYCFGKNRAGNVDILKKIGNEKGIKVIKISNIIIDGERASSSIIRECLINRNIKKANLLLNKPYYIFGKVVEGNRLGRTIGFPTANIIPSPNKLLPPDGVYVTKTKYNNRIYDSITNIGKNPTVNNAYRTVETYIFDFNENIYNQNIEVDFYDWIRSVKKFSGIGELKEQIAKDINVASSFLNRQNIK